MSSSLPSTTPLHEAAEHDDVSALGKILADGVPANVRAHFHDHRCVFDNGRTALHVAARNGNLEVALALLEAGADVNGLEESQDECDGQDPFPLHEAAIGGHADIVKCLLDAGAMRDPCATVERLPTEIGVDVDENEHHTPLYFAVELGKVEVVRILVESGVDVNAQNNATPLHAAAKTDDAEILAILIYAGAEVDVQDEMGCTPLHYARSLSTVSALLAARANPNIVSSGVDFTYECTPIGEFCSRPSSVDMVDALLRHGVDTSIPVYICSRISGSLVSCAVQKGETDIVSRLLDAGLDPNDADDYGLSPIHIATICGHAAVLRLLLQRGVDRDSRGGAYGSTPLHLACRHDELECVRELLRWKVSLTTREIGPGSGYLPEDVIGIFNDVCYSGPTTRERAGIACEAIRLALEEASCWWRRGPVILLTARMIKQAALTTSPEMASLEANMAVVGGAESHDAKTYLEQAGTCVGDSLTGSGHKRKGSESDRSDEDGALRGVLERVVELAVGNEVLFRQVVLFL